MNDKDLQDLWNTPSPNDDFIIQHEKLIQNMKAKMNQFDKDIKRRNLRETIAALIVFVAFAVFGGFGLYDGNYLLGFACTIICFGCVFIVYKFVNAQVTISDEEVYTMSNKEYLSYELKKVNEQIRILKSVFWWYILPIAVGLCLFFFAMPYNTTSLIIHIALVLAVSVGLYILNQKAVKKDLIPLKNDLEEQIANLSNA